MKLITVSKRGLSIKTSFPFLSRRSIPTFFQILTATAPSANDCFNEANRLLKKNGILVVQDRTPEDCLLPGDESHLRGYFFELYPHLRNKDISRRYSAQDMKLALESAGFQLEKTVKLWETRRHYSNLDSLQKDLLLRTGRSILHELTDEELNRLAKFIESKLQHQSSIIEKDRWTVWFARKK